MALQLGAADVGTFLAVGGGIRHHFLVTCSNAAKQLAGGSIVLDWEFIPDPDGTTPNTGDLKCWIEIYEDNSSTQILSTQVLDLPGGWARTTRTGTFTFHFTSNGTSGGSPKAGTFRIRARMEYAQVTNDGVNGGYTANSDGGYTRTATPNTWNASLHPSGQDRGWMRAGVIIPARNFSGEESTFVFEVGKVLGTPMTQWAWPEVVRTRFLARGRNSGGALSPATAVAADSTKGIGYRVVNSAGTVHKSNTSTQSKSGNSNWDDGGQMLLDTTSPTEFAVELVISGTADLTGLPWTHFMGNDLNDVYPAEITVVATDNGATTHIRTKDRDNTFFNWDSTVTLTETTNPDSGGVARVYNRGEQVAGLTVKVLNAKGEAFPARSLDEFRSRDTGGTLEETMSVTGHDHTTGVHTLTQTFGTSGNNAPATAEGAAKQIRWRDTATNGPTAVSGDYGFLSSLLNVFRHMQLNDNALDPALNVESLLTSDLAYLSVRVENVRGEPVNGATGTLKMVDQGDQLPEIDLGSVTTTTVNGHVGYTPLNTTWKESKPNGGWDLHANPDFTKDGNTGVLDRNVADPDGFNRIALLAINPNILPIAGVGPALAGDQGDHFHPGDPMLVGVALFDRRTAGLRTPDASPTPVAYIGRFNVSTGRAEYLAADLSWQPLGTADAWVLAASAGDPKVFVRSFADTTGFSEHKVFAVCVVYLDGTPYIVNSDNDTLSTLANPHDRYVFDPTGLFK